MIKKALIFFLILILLSLNVLGLELDITNTFVLSDSNAKYIYSNTDELIGVSISNDTITSQTSTSNITSWKDPTIYQTYTLYNLKIENKENSIGFPGINNWYLITNYESNYIQNNNLSLYVVEGQYNWQVKNEEETCTYMKTFNSNTNKEEIIYTYCQLNYEVDYQENIYNNSGDLYTRELDLKLNITCPNGSLEKTYLKTYINTILYETEELTCYNQSNIYNYYYQHPTEETFNFTLELESITTTNLTDYELISDLYNPEILFINNTIPLKFFQNLTQNLSFKCYDNVVPLINYKIIVNDEIIYNNNHTTNTTINQEVNLTTGVNEIYFKCSDFIGTTTQQDDEIIYNLSVLKEIDSSPFNTNETSSTRLDYFCQNNTYSYNFNTSGNENNVYFKNICDWNMLKLDIVYPTEGSYYRFYDPNPLIGDIKFYALDLTSETGVQITWKLEDLVGEFIGGKIRIKTPKETVDSIITEQVFDAENKAVTYLLKSGYYTLSIISADGTETKNIGYIIADVAGEKTITIPDINFVPSYTVGNNVNWTWGENNINLQYVDTQINTDTITFKVYNYTNIYDPIEIYTTTSTNVGDVTFNYIGAVNNVSYLACFEANHNELGNIKQCKSYYFVDNKKIFGNLNSWTNEEGQKMRNLIVTLFLGILLIVGGMFATEIILLIGIILSLFMKFKIVDYGVTINTGILVFIFVIAGLAFIKKYLWRKK